MQNYIPWILAIIVFGMLSYPILQIVPSKEQKIRIKLRQYALIKGMKVQVRHVALPTEIENTHRELCNTVAYQLPVINDRLGTSLAIRSLNNSNEWFWPDQNRPKTCYIEKLLELYQGLPDYILAVEHSPCGHSFFWHEHGTEETIDKIKHNLQEFEQVFLS